MTSSVEVQNYGARVEAAALAAMALWRLRAPGDMDSFLAQFVVLFDVSDDDLSAAMMARILTDARVRRGEGEA